MRIIRHGDLDIRQIKKLPEGLKKLNTTVLAEGEVTNHFHTLVKEKNDIDVYEDENGIKFFNLQSKTKLTHPEHKTIVVEPGIYRVDIEKEFCPWSSEIEKVRD